VSAGPVPPPAAVPGSEAGGGAVDLAVPPEPAGLRAWARALAESDPAAGRALVADGGWIAEPLWARWGSRLEAAGLDRAAFGRVVAGYSRELWLWVMGERTWAHCAGGLAGRVRRRLPAVLTARRGPG
jgi:hypothetical protein